MKKTPTRSQMLFFSMAGSLAWLMHFFLSYVIAEFGCFGGLQGVTWWIVGVTVPSLLFALWAVMKSLKMKELIKSSSSEFNNYFIRFGVLNNSIFLVIILFETIPLIFFHRRCL